MNESYKRMKSVKINHKGGKLNYPERGHTQIKFKIIPWCFTQSADIRNRQIRIKPRFIERIEFRRVRNKQINDGEKA